MPIVYLYGFKRPIAKKRQVVKRLTDAVVKSYDVPKEIVTVYIFDVPRENAAHFGVLVSDHDREQKKKKKTARPSRHRGR